METHLDEKQLSSAVGFRNDHVNRLVLQEQERVQKILDISGRKCLDLSKKSARTTLLGRMCLDYLVLKGEWYLNRCALTWKAKATKSRRLYFQLVPQVHRTEEIGSGLLLTPTRCEEVQDLDQFQKRMEKYPNGTKMPNLATQIQGLLPTPRVGGEEGYETRAKRQGHEKAISYLEANLQFHLLPTPTKSESIDVARPVVMRGNSPRIQSNQGVDGQAKLVDMLASGLLPTPNRSDVEGGVTQTVSQKNGRFVRTSDTTGTEYGAKLRDAVSLLNQGLMATPNTMDHLPSRSYEAMKEQATNGGRKNRMRPSNLREQIDPMMQQAYTEARMEANNVLLKTPGAQDANMESMTSKGVSGTSGNLAQEAMNGMLSKRMEETTGTTGHLSHHFTLDMMAFPPNWCDISEPVLQRLEKRLKTLKRTSEKKPTTSEKKQSNVQETQ